MTLVGDTGSATLTVTGASTLSGAINIDSGTLSIATASAFPNVSGVFLSNDSNSIATTGLTLTASNTFNTLNSTGNNAIVTLSNGAALTIGDSSNLNSTYSGSITQSGVVVSGALTKNGTGMLDLTGMSSGSLNLVYINATSNSSVVVNGGVLRISANAFVNPNTISLASGTELQLAEGGGSVLANNVIDSGVLHLIGGTLKLTGTGNTYSGGTIVEVGSTLDVTTANISTGNANITNAGGIVLFDQATSGSYSGVISDGRQMEATTGAFLSGSLVKDDSTGASGGNVTLLAKQAYTGGTFVEAGTLTLGVVDAIASSAGVDLGRVGGPLGTGAAAAGGPVTATLALGADNAIRGLMSEAGNNTAVTLNGHTLTINTAAGTAWSFGGVISGGGALIKSGAGAEQLTGINTYTGPTTVNGGLLSVDGSIASSSLTAVNAGGALGGNGIVGNTVINGGILSPGHSIGTLTVSGSLALTSAATYLVEVSPTSADRTNVSGAATLAGSVLAAFQPGSYVVNSYTILHSAGLGGTTFGGLTTSGLPANFNASLSYTATDVMLSLSAALGAGTSLAGNQQNVAGTINNFFNNGGALPPNFLSLFNLTGGNLSNALALISGETATGAQQGAFQMTTQFLGLMLDPFVDGRSGIGGAAGSAIGFAPERAELPNDIALAYASVLKAPVFKAASFEQRWSAWGSAYGGYNRTSGDLAVTGSHDLTASTAGFAAGLDYALARDTVVGVAIAGGGTSWGLAQSLGNGRSDAFQAGVYGTTRWGASYVAASFAFTNYWMSTDRFAFAGDHLSANFNAQSAGGRIEGGYRVATAFGAVTPYAAVQTQGFWTPSYRETDLNAGGFGLAYNARTATDTRTELGGRFDKQMMVDRAAHCSLCAAASPGPMTPSAIRR
jgi:autotransporter-associated beta strand protein